MTDEQCKAFLLGKTAAQNIPKTLISKDGIIEALRQDIQLCHIVETDRQNIMAWYEGLFYGLQSPNGGITPEHFTKALELLFDSNKKRADIWIQFAGECVTAKQYVGFEAVSDEQTEIERWLGTLLAKLFQIDRTQGEDSVEQVCRLAEEASCLYPWEMDTAVERLTNGGTAKDIIDMIESGEIVRDEVPFPKLGDDFQIMFDDIAIDGSTEQTIGG